MNVGKIDSYNSTGSAFVSTHNHVFYLVIPILAVSFFREAKAFSIILHSPSISLFFFSDRIYLNTPDMVILPMLSNLYRYESFQHWKLRNFHNGTFIHIFLLFMIWSTLSPKCFQMFQMALNPLDTPQEKKNHSYANTNPTPFRSSCDGCRREPTLNSRRRVGILTGSWMAPPSTDRDWWLTFIDFLVFHIPHRPIPYQHHQ